MAALHSGWSHSQTAFFASRSGQLPIPFSFKCAGMVVHWFKAWHDWRLHPMLRANDQLPRIDHLLKGAQNRLSQSLPFTAAFWIYNPVDMTSHWVYLNQNGIGSVPNYLSIGQKVVWVRAYTQEGVGPQITLIMTVSYSVHCQDWFIHYGMNDQCIAMSQWRMVSQCDIPSLTTLTVHSSTQDTSAWGFFPDPFPCPIRKVESTVEGSRVNLD